MIKQLADSIEKEMQQVEEEIFSSKTFSEAQESLKKLDELLNNITQTQEFEEANNLVRGLEKGTLEVEGW